VPTRGTARPGRWDARTRSFVRALGDGKLASWIASWIASLAWLLVELPFHKEAAGRIAPYELCRPLLVQ
jgi:hypothetical protein